MNSEMLLTISIPTYNRARNLEFLLGVLERQLLSLRTRVTVYVSDNASTDDTSAVIARYSQRMPNLVSRRNEENLGPDWNIHHAYAAPSSKYVWILGDDDAPVSGGIAQIVEAIDRFESDMIYIPAIGCSNIFTRYSDCKAPTVSSPIQLSRKNFATTVNVMFTFISSCVLKKSVVTPEVLQNALKITTDTNLIQLAWVYETLNHGARFLYMPTPLLLSTNGANSGYGILDVLLANQARIIECLLHQHPSVQKAILFRANISYFPWLIWFMRNNRLGAFNVQEMNSIAVPKIVAGMLSFKFFVVPVWIFSENISGIFYQISRIFGRLLREFDRLITLR